MSVSFRRADPSDCRCLFEWRMDPDTRSRSLQTEAFDYQSHLAWFESSLDNPDRIIILAEDGLRVGMVRFDRIGDCARISINLAPEARGKGLATSILIGSEQFLKAWPVMKISAEIRSDNEASVRAFERAGYRLSDPKASSTLLHYLKSIAP